MGALIYANFLDKGGGGPRHRLKLMAPQDLERLYDEHAQAVFAFLLNLTRHEADTRDLLQQVFVRLARRPELLEGVRDERAFLLCGWHTIWRSTSCAAAARARSTTNNSRPSRRRCSRREGNRTRRRSARR